MIVVDLRNTYRCAESDVVARSTLFFRGPVQLRTQRCLAAALGGPRLLAVMFTYPLLWRADRSEGIGDRDDETTHDVDELINMWRYFGRCDVEDEGSSPRFISVEREKPGGECELLYSPNRRFERHKNSDSHH